ncbi:unnamed protein product, partial [Thlaspi arvense]
MPQWDQDKLHTLFVPSDVQQINRICPSITNVRDTLSWIHTPHGFSTVKSGYFVMRNLITEHSSSLVHLTANSSLFKTVWKTNAPPRLKSFWWRLLCIIASGFRLMILMLSPTRSLIYIIMPPRYNTFVVLVFLIVVVWLPLGLHQTQLLEWLSSSCSINPLQTPEEAEAMALKMAVQEITKLNYKEVTFLGACSPLYLPLSISADDKETDTTLHSITMDVQDIYRLAKSSHHIFVCISRT